jgi:transcriptional regulator with XRE-family HTH domain
MVMTLDEFLQKKIQEYKMAHPRYSSAQIARFWGLSTSSLNRLENQETKKPSIEQAVKILNGVGIKENLFEILNDFYPELKNLFLELSQRD